MAQKKGSAPSASASLENNISPNEQRTATAIGISVVVAAIAVVVAIVAVVWAVNKPAKSEAATAKPSENSAQVSLRQARTNVTAVKTKPEHSNSEGGFLLSKDGIGKPVKTAPTVALYVDFMCPACRVLDSQMLPTWTKMLNAGQINFEIHPSSFFDDLSTDKYSTRAASAVAYVADKDPEHVLGFIAALYDEGFQPKEGQQYKPVSNDAIAAQAQKAGVSPEVAQQAVKGDYTKWIEALAVYTPLRPSVLPTEGSRKGEFATPTITINGNYWDRVAATRDGTDVNTAFFKAIGMQAGDAGTEGVMPSIGASEKPKA